MEKICSQNCFKCNYEEMIPVILTKRSFRQMMLGKEYKSYVECRYVPNSSMVVENTTNLSNSKNKEFYINNRTNHEEDNYCSSTMIKQQEANFNSSINNFTKNSFGSSSNFNLNKTIDGKKAPNNKLCIRNLERHLEKLNNKFKYNNNKESFPFNSNNYPNSTVHNSLNNDLNSNNTDYNISNSNNSMNIDAENKNKIKKEIEELEALSLSVKLVGCTIKKKKLGIDHEEYVFSTASQVPFLVSEADMVTEYNRQKNSQLMKLMFNK
jgi:hypothetical protein